MLFNQESVICGCFKMIRDTCGEFDADVKNFYYWQYPFQAKLKHKD